MLVTICFRIFLFSQVLDKNLKSKIHKITHLPVNSKGFWQWCIMLRISSYLCLVFKKEHIIFKTRSVCVLRWMCGWVWQKEPFSILNINLNLNILHVQCITLPFIRIQQKYIYYFTIQADSIHGLYVSILIYHV